MQLWSTNSNLAKTAGLNNYHVPKDITSTHASISP